MARSSVDLFRDRQRGRHVGVTGQDTHSEATVHLYLLRRIRELRPEKVKNVKPVFARVSRAASTFGLVLRSRRPHGAL